MTIDQLMQKYALAAQEYRQARDKAAAFQELLGLVNDTIDRSPRSALRRVRSLVLLGCAIGLRAGSLKRLRQSEEPVSADPVPQVNVWHVDETTWVN